MADSPDNKVLLKIEADAAGVTAGVEQAKAALRDLEATSAAGNAAQRRVSAELKTQDLTLTAPAGTSGAIASENAALSELAAREATAADAAVRLDEGSKGLGTSVDELSKQQMMGLMRVLGLVSPELQMAGMEAMHLKAGLSALAAVTGMSLGALAGGIAIVVGIALAYKKTAEAVKEATDALNAFYAAQERSRAAGVEKEEEVAKALGKAGRPPSALGGARALAARLERGGVSRGTAVSVAAQLVDNEGKPIVTEDQALSLATAEDANLLKKPIEGQDLEESRRHVAVALRKIQQPRVSDRVAAAVAENAGIMKRRQEALESGRQIDLHRYLVEQEHLTDEEAKARESVIRRQVAEGGPRPIFKVPYEEQSFLEALWADPETAWSQFGVESHTEAGTEPYDPVARSLNQQRRRAESARPSATPPSTAPAPATEPPSTAAPAAADRGLPPGEDPFASPRPTATASPRPAPAPPAAPVTVNYISNYHGPTYAGTQADVNRRVVRMP